ncbi:hypothetical protein [Cellulomonas sp. Leaf334]|uniref:hypothetical protein n=1 Tax=Cellulomonas sp. Leaf334 TaxID=1736339 RepID=UPI0006F2D4F1|nr:hypothetical protein [Cellulomonas sp. Leaf334]KQR16308.1 hypothetical protein ASF78_02575 [Cellulomonas sp. Leaf334]
MPFQAGPTTPIQEPRAPRERTPEASVEERAAAPRERAPEPSVEESARAPHGPALEPAVDVRAVGRRPGDARISPTSGRPPARSGPDSTRPAAAPTVEPVVVGRRFQPVPGGALPRPHPTDPLMAALLATPAAPVFAVTEGTVRRAPAQVAAGAVELRAPDGSALVLLGGPSVAWVVDDEESVAAGTVLGIVAGSPGDPPGEPLLVLAVDATGRQVDAVALLVGLPDPGELDLLGTDSAVGVDPYRLDLELAATLQGVGVVP